MWPSASGALTEGRKVLCYPQHPSCASRGHQGHRTGHCQGAPGPPLAHQCRGLTWTPGSPHPALPRAVTSCELAGVSRNFWARTTESRLSPTVSRGSHMVPRSPLRSCSQPPFIPCQAAQEAGPCPPHGSEAPKPQGQALFCLDQVKGMYACNLCN